MRYDEGNIEGAKTASKIALYLNIAGIVTTVLVSIVLVVVWFGVVFKAADQITTNDWNID